MGKINQYSPDIKDQELQDFVGEVTDLLNNGKVAFSTSTSVPSSAGSEGELRIARVGTNDVRLYMYTNGAWYGSQAGRAQQSGWGFIQVSGTPASQIKAVTFPTAFSSVPFVICTYIGVSTASTDPTSPADFTGANTLRSMAAYAPTTTGFTAAVWTGNGSALTASQYEGFAWIAFAT